MPYSNILFSNSSIFLTQKLLIYLRERFKVDFYMIATISTIIGIEIEQISILAIVVATIIQRLWCSDGCDRFGSSHVETNRYFSLGFMPQARSLRAVNWKGKNEDLKLTIRIERRRLLFRCLLYPSRVSDGFEKTFKVTPNGAQGLTYV